MDEEKKEYGLDPKEDYSEIEEITARIRARKAAQLKRQQAARTRRKIVLGVIVAVIALFVFSLTSFFDVDSIEVRGNSYFTAEEIINMGHAVPGKNLIYQPGKHSICSYLEESPYIKNVKVSRHFPSTLVITVEERKQLGAIKYDNKYLIIDDEGILLRKTKTLPKLTLIDGLIVQKIELGEQIGVKDEELFEQTMDILTKMRDNDLYFVELDMTDMYILAYIYDSLVCKGTYKQISSAIENGRLHKVLDQLFDDNIKRGTITFSNEGYISYVPTI